MDNKHIKILYITRKYPPSIGGMQRMSYHLAQALEKKANLDKITWGYSQVFLPLFIIKVLLQSFIYTFIKRKQYNYILIGDVALSPLGVFLKKIMHTPVIIIAHGLDITFKKYLYQNIVMPSLKKVDRIVCVSSHTKSECIRRAIDEKRINIIPNGVNINTILDKIDARARLKNEGILIPSESKILLSVARLVKRKGIAEFIENVFSKLTKEYPNVIYLVVGDGVCKSIIEKTITKCGLQDNVILLGSIKEELLAYLYCSADIFIMPNIRVKNDVEGFGITVLEASSCGIPTVAFGIEGVQDVIRDGINGFLVPYCDYHIFKEKISQLLLNEKDKNDISAKAKELVKNFSWEKIADRYIEIIKQV
ncbi:MAG: glycosyltransferase family 4 protein [Candidatus Omnitrophota bacterium]|jgi:glycosyltransferase involved in cell wall biosynthesis